MRRKTLANVVGAAVATTLSGVSIAAESPFALKELAAGYMQVAEADKSAGEMKCGEGKCGGKMMGGAAAMENGAMKPDAMKPQAEQQQNSNKQMEGKCAGMSMGAPGKSAAPGSGR